MSSDSSRELRAAELLARALDGEEIDPAEFDAGDATLRGVFDGFRTLHRIDGSFGVPGRQQLGEYTLLREIGRGGMGIVYEADQPSLRRRVALKVLPQTRFQSERDVQRFHNEARAAASLDHENIVAIHAVGNDDGQHYFAMQLIDGISLKRLIQVVYGGGEDGPAQDSAIAKQVVREGIAGITEDPAALGPALAGGVPWQRLVANQVAQVADAIDHAHRVGVLHRDIKPANLLLDGRGKVWVTDFGLASFVDQNHQLTGSQELAGTLAYMAPERLNGQAIGGTSDVYSLGATLFELLAGQPPFGKSDRASVMRRILEEDPPRLATLRDVPPDLETIVMVAMAKEPEARYPTPAALAADLKAFVAGDPITARRLTPWQRLDRWRRRNPLLFATTFSLAVASALLVTIGYFALQAQAAREVAVSAASRTRVAESRGEARAHRQANAAERVPKSLGELEEAVAALPNLGLDPAAEEELLVSIRSEVADTLSVWDIETEQLNRPVVMAHPRGLFAVELDVRKELRVTRSPTNEVLLRIPVSQEVWRPTFDSRGHWLAFSEFDQPGPRKIHLCDLRRGTSRILDLPPPDRTYAHCFLENPPRLMTCSGENLYVVHLETGATETFAKPEGVGEVFDAHALHDGVRVAALTPNAQAVTVFEPGAAFSEQQVPLDFSAWRVVCAPNDDRIGVVGQFGRCLILLNGEVVDRIPGHHATASRLCWSADGALLSTFGWDGGLQVYDTQTHRQLVFTDQFRRSNLCFDQDGSRFGFHRGVDDNAIALRLRPPLALEEYAIADPRTDWPVVVQHPQHPWMLVGTKRGIDVLDLDEHRRLATLPFPTLSFFELNSAGDLLLIDREGLSTHRVDPAAEFQTTRLSYLDRHRSRFGAFGKAVITYGGLGVLRYENGTKRHLKVPLPGAASLAVSPDSSWGFSSGWSGKKAFIANLDSMRVVAEPKLRRAEGRFSADSRWLFVGARGEGRLYSVPGFEIVGRYPRKAAEPHGAWADFAPDGKSVIWTRDRYELEWLDLTTGAPRIYLRPPGRVNLRHPRFSRDGRYVIALAGAHRIMRWDLQRIREELRRMSIDW